MGRKRTIKILFISILLLVLLSSSAAATSLWSDKSASIYTAKPKVYHVGDVITVMIEESSDATQSADTNLSQNSNAKGGAGVGLFSFLKAFGFNYSDQDGAKGQTNRSGSLTADLTTTIVGKNDNGNYKIEGTKTIKINGEQQVIKLSGIIRPQDVSSDNTITSQKIANASIDFEGKGVIAAKQRPNIFQRILNWIF
jgi:flagellar L-ring protein precursor FlgH